MDNFSQAALAAAMIAAFLLLGGGLGARRNAAHYVKRLGAR